MTLVMTFRHVWPFRKNTAGIRVLFAGIGWETSTELSTTQPSSYRVPATSGRLPMQAETSSFALSRKTGCWDTYKTVYSNGPILYRYLVIGSLVATSKGKANYEKCQPRPRRPRVAKSTGCPKRNRLFVSLCRVPNGIRAK